ncbi:MAG: amidohydrolase [Clostridiales bacterium]|nr:amidohydrolase [Clostridiales bacterium]
MVIKNARIHTMEDGYRVIGNGWLSVENGVISEIGEGEYKGAGNEVIDAEGAGLYPGFIDGHSHIGVMEDSLTFEGDDVNEMTDPVTPFLRAIDCINPFDRAFREAYEGGVTCVAAGPGSANPIGGQFACIKTCGRRVDEMIVKAPVSMKMAMGENPKRVYHGKGRMPETRMATAAIIREALFKARKYSEEEKPAFDFKSEALKPVIKGELTAHIHSHRADDIFTAIRICREFDLDFVIVHCTEGHLIADYLAKEKVRAFVGPNLSDRSKPELSNSTFANAGILDKAGVLIGITVDHPVTPLQYLPICAGYARKAGLSDDSALAAITINPAKILGVDDRVGSLKPGKDADLSVIQGDPLDVRGCVKHVWIGGRQVK